MAWGFRSQESDAELNKQALRDTIQTIGEQVEIVADSISFGTEYEKADREAVEEYAARLMGVSRTMEVASKYERNKTCPTATQNSRTP